MELYPTKPYAFTARVFRPAALNVWLTVRKPEKQNNEETKEGRRKRKRGRKEETKENTGKRKKNQRRKVA
jgi:hypothetical protein